jgi:hypothetical protein
MRNFDRRLSKLERRFGIASSEVRFQIIMSDLELGPTGDAYIQPLSVPRGHGIEVEDSEPAVDIIHIDLSK